MGTITGNQNPIVGETNSYAINLFGAIPFISTNASYEWYLFKKQKSGSWIDITKNGVPKKGTKVDYKFFEPVAGDLFEIRVFEVVQGLLPSVEPSKKLFGKLEARPTASRNVEIDKVVLFNRGKKDINKASYRDTLVAQAFCTGLFGKEIEFQLWEDDAPGKGHDAAVNKNNKIPHPFKATVNEKGIAEVKIPLSADEKIMRQIADKFLMRGDSGEGANHEYYVTATYFGKGKKASQVNVLVANPDYQPKPKTDSPKFQATFTGKTPKQPDAKGKILDAYFADAGGGKLTTVQVGKKVQVIIKTSGMVGKHIQYKVWEYDLGNNDLVYESGKIKVVSDLILTGGFTINQGTFGKGIDFGSMDSDSGKQNYFLEVIPMDVSAESQKFGVNSEGLMEVEHVKSPTMVKTPETKKANGEKCFCNRDFEEKDVRKFVKLLKGSEIIWEGQAAKGGKRITCNIDDKSFSTLTKGLNAAINKYKINTCAQKMHFLAQVCEETGTFALSEESKSIFASSESFYKGRGVLQLTGVRKKDKKSYDAPGPYQDYADYKGDKNIVKNPGIVATNINYCIDSGAWIWSINKKMPSNKKSQAVIKWGKESAGKSLNELALYVDKYLELISVLLNGRNAKTNMPNGWEKRKSNYNLLKTGFFRYDYFHGSNNKPVDAKKIVTFHIYHDGKIEKHIPKEIKKDYENKYSYIYHDTAGKEHDICTVNFEKVQNWIVGSKKDGGKGWAKRTVGGRIRYYQMGTGKAELVKVVLPINYSKDGVVLKIGDNTTREYLNPKAFASMLGAVANCGYEDFKFNGSTSSDGTGAPSLTHVNGVSFDFRYLRKDKTGNNLHIDTEPNALDITRQEKFIDELIRFGYSQFYSYNIIINKKKFILKNSTHLAEHNHHLHVRREGYKPNFKEIKY